MENIRIIEFSRNLLHMSPILLLMISLLVFFATLDVSSAFIL